jgi:hypothetical protein
VDAVEQQIAAYRAVPFDEDGEAWGKVSALEALEDHLPDERVLDFFLEVIADPAEYDLAGVELAKLFELDPVPAQRARIGELLAAALVAEEDDLVRQWLARAVACYTDVPAARAAAIGRVLDPEEDEDVRHNCLTGLCRAEPEVVRVLRQLAGAPGSLGGAARDHLARLTDAARPLGLHDACGRHDATSPG